MELEREFMVLHHTKIVQGMYECFSSLNVPNIAISLGLNSVKIFLFRTTKQLERKCGWNMLLVVFSANWKFKMASTTGHIWTYELMGKFIKQFFLSQIVEIWSWLNPNCIWIIGIPRLLKKFENCHLWLQCGMKRNFVVIYCPIQSLHFMDISIHWVWCSDWMMFPVWVQNLYSKVLLPPVWRT